MTHTTDTSTNQPEQLIEDPALWGMIGESLAHVAALLTKVSATDDDTLFGRAFTPNGEGPRVDEHAVAALKGVEAARSIVSARLASNHAKSAENAAQGGNEAMECMRDASKLATRHRQAVVEESIPREEQFYWTDAHDDLQAGLLAGYAAEWARAYRARAAMPSRRVMTRTGDRWPVKVEQVNEDGKLIGWKLSIFGQEAFVPETDDAGTGESNG
jgi:hypothetical protein